MGVINTMAHYQPKRRYFLGLMLRSRTSSAFTRVFDALWCGVSKHEAALILRDAALRAAPQDEGRPQSRPLIE